MRPVKGFHLLELLITISFIGILASLSLPLYSHYFVQEKRLEAAHMLSKLAIALEKYHIEHDTYVGASLALLNFPEFVANNNYQLMIQTTSEQTFLLAAKPLGQQAEKDLSCATLTLHSTGEKANTGSAKVEECW